MTPAIDAVRRVSEKDLLLNLSLPQSEQAIFWGSGTSVKKLSSNIHPPIYLGQMWSDTDLSGMEGYVIKRIETTCLAGINYTLYIRQGAKIYTQSIPEVSTSEKVVITLDKEFVISDDAPLYCTLRVNSGEGYLVATDDVNIVEGKGNIVSVDGYEWLSLDTKGNISITPILSPPLNGFKGVESVSEFGGKVVTSSCPVAFEYPERYVLYRNGEQVATFTELKGEYTDKNLTNGTTYEYRLEALYRNGEVKISNPYSFYLSEKSFLSQIGDVEVNGVILDEENEGIYNYSATCLNDYAEVFVTAENNGVVIINGVEGEEYVEDISLGGKFILPITIVSESGESSREYKLNLYKLPENILMKRWDDVLVVMNNPDNNGSLSFIEYRWYLNGEELSAKEPYITIPSGVDANDMFSVKVVTEEGVELTSCEVGFDAISADVLLYPNIVERGGEITLNITAPISTSISASMVHITGQTNTLSLSLGENKIKAPQVPGTYIINVVLSSGTTKSLKFMVR